jgi:hypothetical protein
MMTIGSTAAALALAVPAHAIFSKLNTTTTLAVSPVSATEGTAITLNASVKIATVNSLGIFPTGTVTFVARNSLGATVTLGTTSLHACFLLPCHAILTTSAVPVGTVSATAKYGGDNFTNPSSGSHALTIAPNPNPGSTSTVICFSGQPCDSGTLNSNDSTTQLDVNSGASSNPQTVTASLGNGTLHCVEPAEEGGPDADGDDDDGAFVGSLATFSSTATDAGKTITYTGTGSTGATMKHQLQEHPSHAGCWGSPTPFKGYTNGVYGDAPFVEADGLYEAMPAACHTGTNALPCMNGVAGSGTTYSYKVRAPAGDPKLIG